MSTKRATCCYLHKPKISVVLIFAQTNKQKRQEHRKLNSGRIWASADLQRILCWLRNGEAFEAFLQSMTTLKTFLYFNAARHMFTSAHRSECNAAYVGGLQLKHWHLLHPATFIRMLEKHFTSKWILYYNENSATPQCTEKGLIDQTSHRFSGSLPFFIISSGTFSMCYLSSLSSDHLPCIIITSAKEVMWQLAFICLLVNKITGKVRNVF